MTWMRYPGKVHQDGVAALIDTIMNCARAHHADLHRTGAQHQGRIGAGATHRRARTVRGHARQRAAGLRRQAHTRPECNVVSDVPAARSVFTAPWPMTITPLDTCGLVQLKGDKYRQIAASTDPLTRAVIENYRIWRKAGDPHVKEPLDASSVLFDTVAIYLAFSSELVTFEELPIAITDDGLTRIDQQAKRVTCAMAWKDLAKFEDFLVDRFTRDR